MNKQLCIAFVAILTLVSCTKQRDLFIENSPLFVVKADWSQSTISPQGATALVFSEQRAVLDNPYMQPATTTQPQKVAPDRYDVLVFNNLMFSPTDNEFANITLKGTDRFSTFEAHAREKTEVNDIFRSDANEVFVYNPDVIAAATFRNKVVEDANEYVKKYEDGIKTGNYEGGYVNDEIELTPVRLTRNVQVVLRVNNYKPNFAIYGTLRGFAGGVNLSTRYPVGSKVTHAGFAINNVIEKLDIADYHIVSSEVFTSFGPMWNNNENSYTLDILARYKGQTDAFAYSFDVTKCVDNVVIKSVEQSSGVIKTEEELYQKDGTIPKMETIIIEVALTLPDVIGDDGGIDVGVDDWGDVVIIPIPMNSNNNFNNKE